MIMFSSKPYIFIDFFGFGWISGSYDWKVFWGESVLDTAMCLDNATDELLARTRKCAPAFFRKGCCICILTGWLVAGRPGVARGYPREQHPRNPRTGTMLLIVFEI